MILWHNIGDDDDDDDDDDGNDFARVNSRLKSVYKRCFTLTCSNCLTSPSVASDKASFPFFFASILAPA
jgi:hypothetical protein